MFLGKTIHQVQSNGGYKRLEIRHHLGKLLNRCKPLGGLGLILTSFT